MLIGPRNLTVEGRLIEALMNRCGSEKRVKAMSLFVPREERGEETQTGNLFGSAEIRYCWQSFTTLLPV
jgi:hypothetical protein